MTHQQYTLELKIDLIETLPIGMTIACNKPENEQELNERISYLETAKHWLQIQIDNEKRFWEYHKNGN